MALLLLAMLVPLLLSPGAGRLRCAVATGSIECCCVAHGPSGSGNRSHAERVPPAPECCAVALARGDHDGRDGDGDGFPGGDDGPCGCDEHRIDASPAAFDGAAPLPPMLALEAPWPWLPHLDRPALRAGLAPEAAPPDGTGPPLYLRYAVFLI